MLTLYVQAPFAVFRTFTAGSFRPTAGFITPSAAYGLLLNVAGIEMRHYDEEQPMTLIAKNLPHFDVALGALQTPLEHTLYQQLHNYPVGSSGQERAESCKGNKYNITPVRRAFLSDVRGYIAMRNNEALEEQVKLGLRGETPHVYGLPFLGDNNFLLDRLQPVGEPEPACWYEPLKAEAEGEGPRFGVTRLTVAIDRADMSQTRSTLFAPGNQATKEIPETAWVKVGY